MSTTETTPDETTEAPAAEETLADYKRKVREEALRVATAQRWCDDGLNETLEKLGLAQKRTYRIPVTVTETRIVFFGVKDAESEEEARALAVTEEFVTKNLSSNGKIVGVSVVEPKDPDEQEKGDLDTTYTVSRRQCENYEGGFYCTREPGHGGTQHIGGNGEIVQAVWPVVAETEG